MRASRAGAALFFGVLVCCLTSPATASETPVTHIDTEDNVIALTLDDGYRPSDELLSYLEERDIDGTAFIVGQVADDDPAFVRRVDSMGWVVCSHTYEHTNLTKLSAREIRTEMLRGIEAVENAVGYRCPYFRAPFGAVNDDVMSVADELGLTVIGWDASLSDSSPGVTEADQLRVVERDLHPGSILLGHWGGVHSLSVLSQTLERLEDEGYRVVDVRDLLEGTGPVVEPEPDVIFDLPVVQIELIPSGHRALDWRRFAMASAPGSALLLFAASLALLTRRTSRRRLALATAMVSRPFDGT